LAGKDACESQNGAFIRARCNSIHRIALTVPKAAVLSREWIQAFKKNWGAHVVISKEFRMFAFVFLNDTISRDDPMKHSGVSFHAAVFHSNPFPPIGKFLIKVSASGAVIQ
jgi:hypothetical protein